MLGIYTQASTANPTGRRPWNSRLAFYSPNTFPLPTAGRGPFLLQPGMMGRPMANGGVPGTLTPGLSCDCCPQSMGLAGTNFPNFANFQRPRQSRRRFDSTAPLPFYQPVSASTAQLSGLGQNETQILGVTVDPTLLALGAAALFAVFYLTGRGAPRRKRRRLQRKISRAQSQLRAIEAA